MREKICFIKKHKVFSKEVFFVVQIYFFFTESLFFVFFLLKSNFISEKRVFLNGKALFVKEIINFVFFYQENILFNKLYKNLFNHMTIFSIFFSFSFAFFFKDFCWGRAIFYCSSFDSNDFPTIEYFVHHFF